MAREQFKLGQSDNFNKDLKPIYFGETISPLSLA